MDIGLNIADGVRVRVGDKISDVTESLKQNKIEYEIPYQAESRGKIDMVMFLEHCGVELNINNGRLTFIKTNNSDLNFIMQLEQGMTPVEALKKIKQNLADSFKIMSNDIRIDRFDGRSLNSALSIPMDNGEKVKLELVMGIHQKVFLHSIQLTA